jgi:hypothetical protein
MKNAILKAGKTKPTIGTKIEGKMMLPYFIFKKLLLIRYQFCKLILLIVYKNVRIKHQYKLKIYIVL